MTTVACVLRSGGDYRPEHVAALYHGVRRHWPGPLNFVCLTDARIDCDGVLEIPLEHDWRGWWSKLELFRPGITGDLLFFDLDTVIVGDLSDIAAVRSTTMMRDVYRRGGLQSSMMYIPESVRPCVWEAWTADPEGHTRRFRDDQRFLETLWLDTADRWQDVLPGQVVSYKADVRKCGLSEEARVVIYHGRPRPWETELWVA